MYRMRMWSFLLGKRTDVMMFSSFFNILACIKKTGSANVSCSIAQFMLSFIPRIQRSLSSMARKLSIVVKAVTAKRGSL